MRWVCNEMIQYNMQISNISDWHRGIKVIFDRSHLRWSIQCGEAVHRYCMQHVTKKYIRKQKKVRKNEDNFKDDSRMRLENLKKPRHS
jgi:hypothetical protein